MIKVISPILSVTQQILRAVIQSISHCSKTTMVIAPARHIPNTDGRTTHTGNYMYLKIPSYQYAGASFDTGRVVLFSYLGEVSFDARQGIVVALV